MTASCYQPLDEALEAIAGYGITLNNGNSNHAPMVAEALCALGRPEAVMPWIAAYRQRLLPRSPPAEPIGAETWCRALGCRDRFADWAEFFAEELGQWSWREVLDRWMGTPGAGVLRRRDPRRYPRRPRRPRLGRCGEPMAPRRAR